VVVILEKHATPEQVENIIKHLEGFGFQVHKSTGAERTIIVQWC
jgi:hypothetical protein